MCTKTRLKILKNRAQVQGTMQSCGYEWPVDFALNSKDVFDQKASEQALNGGMRLSGDAYNEGVL